jgi:hypothetical protein
MDKFVIAALVLLALAIYEKSSKEGLLGSIPPISEQEIEVSKFNNPNLIVAPRTTDSVEASRALLVNLNKPEDRHDYIDHDASVEDRTKNTIARGVACRTNLTEAYFSRENIDRVHQMIINEVFSRSDGRFKIDKQDENDLIIIMRSIWVSYGRNLPDRIDEQVAELNGLVVNECVPKIMSEVSAYRTYARTIGRVPEPIPRAVNLSSAGSKQLRSVTSTF